MFHIFIFRCDYCSLSEVKVKEEFTVVEGLVGVGNAVTTCVVDDVIGGGTEAVAALVMEGLEGVDTGSGGCCRHRC